MSDDDRPDETFEHAGLTCAMNTGSMGIRCGYVGVPKSHPLYGQGYWGIEGIEVHGGLTFADHRWPALGDLWWLGFDCGHGGDFVQARHDFERRIGAPHLPGTVRTPAYVEAETRSLAEQLAALDTEHKATGNG